MSEKSLTHFQTAMADVRELWKQMPTIPAPSPMFDYTEESRFSSVYRTFEAFIVSMYRRSVEDGFSDYEISSKIIRNVNSARSKVFNAESTISKYRVDMVLNIDFGFYENNWTNSASLVANDILEFSHTLKCRLTAGPMFQKQYGREINDIGIDSFLRKNPTSDWYLHLTPDIFRTTRWPDKNGLRTPESNPTLDFHEIDISIDHSQNDPNEEQHIVSVSMDIRGISVMSRIFQIIAIRQTQLAGHLAQRSLQERAF